MGDGSFSALMAEATRYIGYPYVWGGSSPDTSFDCSGYICWVYTRSGVYHLSRTTAQGIYDQCAIVSREEARPGDLVFFTGTYASAGAVSHVGIYVGGSRMLHCGSPIAQDLYPSLLEQPSVCFWKAGNYSGMRQLKMKFVQICLDSLWICDIDF